MQHGFGNGYSTFNWATSATFRHGRDLPITRANIELRQLDQEARGQAPLTSQQLAHDFVSLPAPRHFRRAAALMGGSN